MSQYIPGIVDYVPQVQPYKPNLNFYQQVLETKNAQYKEGYQQISSLYGNLLESPMLRTENIELRNKFFNQISAEISKISSLDLSLPQNIEAAQKVFQPLVDNKYILKDMSYTKRAYAELNKADNFRNCTDEKKCGGKYWEGGVRAIQYQMGDFAKSSAEDSLGFDAPRYTPAVNITEKAMKFAKEMGFNPSFVSWSPDGRYMITTKNGPQMIPSLTDAFLATFQNDQGAIDYYNTQGYLNRKDYSYANADKYGSVDLAESAYLDEMSKKIFDTSQVNYENSQKDLYAAKNKQDAYDTVIRQKGIDPNDPNDQQIAASRNQALVDQMISQAAGDYYKKTQEKIDPETINIVGLDAKRKRVDAAIANALFTNDLASAAHNYAMLTMEQTVTEDKFSLAKYDHDLSLARMQKQFEYDVERDNIKTANEILKQTFGEGANGANFEGQSANPAANIYEIYQAASKGGAAEQADLVKSDEQEFQNQNDSLTSELTTYAKSVNETLNAIINQKVGSTIPAVTPGSEPIVIDESLKQWAKDKQVELFGRVKSETKEIQQSKSPTTDFGSAAGSTVANMLPPFGGILPVLSAAAKAFGKKETPGTYNALSGGYLNEDGSLVKNLTEVSDFATSDKNGWYQLGEKLNSFANDPYTNKVFGSLMDIKSASSSYNRTKKDYFATLEVLKNNKKTVHAATLGINQMYSGAISPEYTKTMLGKIYDNGRHLTEQEFIEMYANNRPSIQKSNTAYQSRFGLGESTFTYNDFKDEAKDIYKTYKENYEKIYNREDNAPIKGVALQEYNPLNASINVNSTGSGVEAKPLITRGIDAAYRGDLGARDAREILTKLESLPSARFYAADGSNITKEYLDDYEQSPTSTKNALNLIKSHLSSGKKKTDDGRARFDLVIHPIVGNDANLAAVTFMLDQEFLENQQGSDKTPKALRKSEGVYTVVMNQEDADKLSVFQRMKKGPYTRELEAYDRIVIDAYDKAGELTITKSNVNSDGLQANGYLNFVNDDYSEGRRMFYVEANPGQTADSFGRQIEGLLQSHYLDMARTQELIRSAKPNLITDPNSLYTR